MADHCDFGSGKRISVSGTIEDSNTVVLINGEKHIAGMEAEITIRTTENFNFGDTSARQIRFLERDFGDPTPIISKATGYINFSAARKGTMPSETWNDTVFVEAAVPEQFFADLSRWLQTSGVSLKRMSLEAFGEALVEVDSYGGITYHWQIPEKASGPAYLLLAGLS